MRPNAFDLRQTIRSGPMGLMLVLCVALSIVSVTGLGGFAQRVNRVALKDTQALLGGDILIHSNYPFPETLQAEIDRLTQAGGAQSARIYHFLSMVRTPADNSSLLAMIKVVSDNYPLYGTATLASGRVFGEILAPGTVIVEKALLDRLNVKVGDRLQVGRITMTIADVVTAEPDRPVNIFALGPRIFIHIEDLARADLVGPGSRVRYKRYLKLADPSRATVIQTQLQAGLPSDVTVDTFRTAPSRIKRFFDQFFFFLKIVALLTFVLAGIGIQSTLHAFVAQKRVSVAIMKTVGATGRFVTTHMMTVVLLLALCGIVSGVVGGLAFQLVLPVLFAPLLDVADAPLFIKRPLLEGLLGFALAAVCAWAPLRRGRKVRALTLFLPRPPLVFSKQRYRIVGLVLFWIAVGGLFYWTPFPPGIYLVLGVLFLFSIIFVLSHGVLWGLSTLQPKQLVLRQALRGLERPHNLTRPVVITLTLALTALFTIYLTERNLNDAYISSYPPDLPNLFLIDIQPRQKNGVAAMVGPNARFYPVTRARLTAINGAGIDLAREKARRGDNLARPFNLTYRNDLLEDERLIEGDRLFQPNPTGIQVSVMDTVAQMGPMRIGDTLQFTIQGVPLEAVVVSIRSREEESVRPFFYFVFEPKDLQDAPHTLFTALNIPAADDLSALQNNIAAQYPNVTALDMTQTLKTLSGVLGRISKIVRFFGLFSLLAGVLIVISSIMATRMERLRETVYYKIVGATRKFITRVLITETTVIALVSALQALLLSHLGTFWLCRKALDVPCHAYPAAGVALVLANLVMVTGVGWLFAQTILNEKPARFLKEQIHDA